MSEHRNQDHTQRHEHDGDHDHAGMCTEPARELLRTHGLRYSRPRAAILDIFREPGRGHMSAEALHLALRDRGEDVSLSTVYLNLGVLKGAGLVREFGGTAGEAIYDVNTDPHYHLICAETGEIIDVPQPEVNGVPLGRFLREHVERATGWRVEEPRIALRGRRPGDP